MKSRNTRQKELLEKEINKIKGFFTAEELYSRIENSGIGIATIYRFLKEKTKNRQLHSYVCDGRNIYSNSSSSHSHYTCQICGKRSHIEIKDIGKIRKSIKGSICHFQIDVTGVCENCMKRNTAEHNAVECKH